MTTQGCCWTSSEPVSKRPTPTNICKWLFKVERAGRSAVDRLHWVSTASLSRRHRVAKARWSSVPRKKCTPHNSLSANFPAAGQVILAKQGSTFNNDQDSTLTSMCTYRLPWLVDPCSCPWCRYCEFHWAWLRLVRSRRGGKEREHYARIYSVTRNLHNKDIFVGSVRKSLQRRYEWHLDTSVQGPVLQK